MFDTDNIASIILHIMIISTFIAVFYFTYGTYLEGITLNYQMQYLAQSLLGDLKILSPELANALKYKITNINISDLQSQDQSTYQSNLNIKLKALLSIGCLVLTGTGLLAILNNYHPINFKKIMIEESIPIMSAMLIYFLYATFILSKYRSIDPNYIRKTILQTVNSYKKN